MAGRRIYKRELTDEEFRKITETLDEHNVPIQCAMTLRSLISEICVDKYSAGYQTGYHRKVRGTAKEGMDEDEG